MINVLKLVTNLIKGNQLGVEVKDLTESRKDRLAEALLTFISVDNAVALVTMGELVQFKEVRKGVLPSFRWYGDAKAIQGEEVMTLRPEAQGTRKLTVPRRRSQRTWGPPLMEEDWVVLCQAPYQSINEGEWTEMREKLKEVTKKCGLKRGLGSGLLVLAKWIGERHRKLIFLLNQS